jgi:2-polyprenyl-6-methoxyphenol hydroxylase-like FAD-dependent oxidoreductase
MRARVLVAGGGPAGLCAAAALARAGAEVTLCEAGAFGRPKLCGEFLSPDAEEALAAAGLAGLAERSGAPAIGAVRVTVARRGRTAAEASAPIVPGGHGIARADLDAALARAAKAAGADVRDRCRVESLDSDEDGVEARCGGARVAADVAIVATGRVPGVGGSARRPGRRWVAVKTHVRGIALPGVTELHFVRGAYAGLNEVASGGARVVNVCALATCDAWERAGASPDAFWELLARESPAFGERWRRAQVVAGSEVAAAGFSFDTCAPAGKGPRPVLRVGDAAALIAPLAGDGQAMAAIGGVEVAAVLARSLPRLRDARAVRDAAEEWDARFRARFASRLRVGRALQSALLRPVPAAWIVRAVAGLRPIGPWVYRRTRGPLRAPRPSERASASPSPST